MVIFKKDYRMKMKKCCLQIEEITNKVIHDVTWIDIRKKWGGHLCQDIYFIGYTCNKCGRKWYNDL